MRDWLWWLLASVHLLAGAAWFGAMFYSPTVLHPRAGQFFKSDDEQFESFIATLAKGARGKVLFALALIGLSGIAMIPLTQKHGGLGNWNAIMAARTILRLLAILIFCRVSWRLWPARIFALPDELPLIRCRFRGSTIALIGIAAAAMVMGVMAHGR